MISYIAVDRLKLVVAPKGWAPFCSQWKQPLGHSRPPHTPTGAAPQAAPRQQTVLGEQAWEGQVAQSEEARTAQRK